MEIAVAIEKPEIHSAVSYSFGKSRYFLFYSNESKIEQIIRNPFLGTLGGAGIQTAQLLIEKNADAAIVNHIGWNAFRILYSAGIKVYHFEGGTAEDAIKNLMEGKLITIEITNYPSLIAANTAGLQGKNKKRKRYGRKNNHGNYCSFNKSKKEK